MGSLCKSGPIKNNTPVAANHGRHQLFKSITSCPETIGKAFKKQPSTSLVIHRLPAVNHNRHRPCIFINSLRQAINKSWSLQSIIGHHQSPTGHQQPTLEITSYPNLSTTIQRSLLVNHWLSQTIQNQDKVSTAHQQPTMTINIHRSRGHQQPTKAINTKNFPN